MLLFLIVPDQTASGNGRLIGEAVCLILDITELCDLVKLSWYVMIIWLWKGIRFCNLLKNMIPILKKHSFGENFIDQESYVINDTQHNILPQGN